MNDNILNGTGSYFTPSREDTGILRARTPQRKVNFAHLCQSIYLYSMEAIKVPIIGPWVAPLAVYA